MKKKNMRKSNPRIKEKIEAIRTEERKSELDKADVIPVPVKCWVVEENRIGVFHMTAAVLTYVDWKIYQQLIQNFMITGCQMSPDKKVFQYLAFSPLFEKHSRLEQKKVPLYQINVTVDKKRRVSVVAKKMEESKIVGAPKGAKIVDMHGKEIKL